MGLSYALLKVDDDLALHQIVADLAPVQSVLHPIFSLIMRKRDIPDGDNRRSYVLVAKVMRRMIWRSLRRTSRRYVATTACMTVYFSAEDA
jgi:hypothetical protein